MALATDRSGGGDPGGRGPSRREDRSKPPHHLAARARVRHHERTCVLGGDAGCCRPECCWCRIARYHHRFNWCTDAAHATITEARHSAWGTCHSPFCQFMGNIEMWERGGAGFPNFTGFARGHFCFGAGEIPCAYSRHPYHEGQVSATTRDMVHTTRYGG